MRRTIKWLCSVMLVLGLLAGASVAVSAWSIIHRAGTAPVLTASGRYKIEAVSAAGIFTLFEKGYVRITDLAQPQRVYRSPVVFDGSIDFSHLDETQDGLIFVGPFFFDTRKQRFFTDNQAAARGVWMSYFVSNVPCDVLH
ncbi:hypothetical protein [Janthinobacterium sp. RB2R34]|uniref:hypothetical protein n=1 Tax=Janthinobacterium sp. RB2R34 TaxID=3424193 RepID=UPI003F29EDE8